MVAPGVNGRGSANYCDRKSGGADASSDRGSARSGQRPRIPHFRRQVPGIAGFSDGDDSPLRRAGPRGPGARPQSARCEASGRRTETSVGQAWSSRPADQAIQSERTTAGQIEEVACATSSSNRPASASRARQVCSSGHTTRTGRPRVGNEVSSCKSQSCVVRRPATRRWGACSCMGRGSRWPLRCSTLARWRCAGQCGGRCRHDHRASPRVRPRCKCRPWRVSRPALSGVVPTPTDRARRGDRTRG
jgi:hypothetical protein